jgi:hypothetical protein
MKLTREEFDYVVETLKTSAMSNSTLFNIGMMMLVGKDNEEKRVEIEERSEKIKKDELKKSSIILGKLYAMESELVEE